MSSKSDWSEWKTSNGTKVLYRNINIGVTNRIMAMYETQRQEVEQPYVEVTVGTKGNKTEKQVINPAYLKAHPEHQEEYDNYLAKIAEIDQAESDHITRIVLKSIKIPDEVNLEEWKETMEELYELEVPEDESDAQMMWLETVAFPTLGNDMVDLTAEIMSSHLDDPDMRAQISAMFRSQVQTNSTK